MFDDSKSGMGWIVILFFLFILFFFFGMGGNGWGNNRNGWGNCEGTSNCAVERQEIIDAAKTQYMIENTSRNTQEYLGTKIDFYEFQNLRDALAVERNKNMALENRIYSDAQFTALSRQMESCCCGFERRLDGIECRMLTKPNLYGIASTCSGQIIPPITTTAAAG